MDERGGRSLRRRGTFMIDLDLICSSNGGTFMILFVAVMEGGGPHVAAKIKQEGQCARSYTLQKLTLVVAVSGGAPSASAIAFEV